MRLSILAVLCACSAPAMIDAPTTAAPARDTTSTTSATSTHEAPPAPRVAPSIPKASRVIVPPRMRLGTWKRVLEHDVVSVAIGKKRVAVLAKNGDAWMLERESWQPLGIPDSMRPGSGERDEARIYFGRDDRPRIMGTRFDKQGVESGIYLRWKGDWRNKPGEIGRLENDPPAAYFGLLGWDDPEVVCKIGDICIIKRLTGWTMIPVGKERLIVELAGKKSAVGVGNQGAYRVGKKAWKAIAAGHTWTSAPGGVWGDDKHLFVSEPAKKKVHHWDGQRWTAAASVLDEPRGLWGTAPDDVWLAGKTGIAHFDGKSWAPIAGPKGAIVDIRGRTPDTLARGTTLKDSEIWAVGPAGVWKGQR
jgi:hypothetical protein